MDTSRINVSETYSATVVEDSGVSWAAIIGGAIAASGLALVLVPFGTAFGLSRLPLSSHAELHRFTIAGGIWLIVVQWLTAGIGGYLTGRLRTKWQGAHTHEVFFRDTVHGFLSWALAAFVGAALLAAMATDNSGVPSPIDESLFRSLSATTLPTDAERDESSRIITADAVEGEISPLDRTYLIGLIVKRTGVSEVEADARINEALVREKDTLRATGHIALFTTLSLLVGAFVAAAAGALGGIHRDVHYEHGRLTI